MSHLGDKKASCSHLYITFYCFPFSVLYVVYTITLSQRDLPLLLFYLLPFSTSQNLSHCGIGRCQKLSSPDWGLKGVVVVTICQQLMQFPNLPWKVVSWDHFLGPLLGWFLLETNAKKGMCRWYIWKTRKSWCRVRETQTGLGMQTATYSNIQLLWWLIGLYPIRRNFETSSFKHLYSNGRAMPTLPLNPRLQLGVSGKASRCCNTSQCYVFGENRLRCPEKTLLC